ncbi:MAG: hypothetical protein Q9227_005051 [Pyrenula ochraceoflavens]
MLDQSDIVAIVSLVIALVAFILALIQATQTTIGTADGLRKCKPSVMGPFGRLTRLRPVWWELRMETRYTTPEIVLETWNYDSPEEIRRRIQKLGMAQPLVREPTLTQSLENIVRNLRKPMVPIPESPPKEALDTLTSLDAHNRWHWKWFRRQNARSEADDESPYRLSEKETSKLRTSERRIKRAHDVTEELVHAGKDKDYIDQGNLVEWYTFLRELHRLHTQEWPGECSCEPRDRKEDWNKIQISRPQRTMVMLFLRERSWDFVPPDVVRPLASIRINTLIILVTRLGMEWRGLSLASSHLENALSADGNGYVVGSTSIRGLGTVVRFGNTGKTSQPTARIPSTAADKMLFGILPGCQTPGRKPLCDEYRLIGDDRKAYFRQVFEDLRVSDSTIEDFCGPELREKHAFRERIFIRCAVNDTLILLCPFLPLEKSPSTDIAFYAWAGQNRMSSMVMWETRRPLLTLLSARPKTGEMHYVHSALEYLQGEEGYKYDYYHVGPTARWSIMNTTQEPGVARPDAKAVQHFVEKLRRYFDHTTTYFDNLQGPPLSETEKTDIQSQLTYTDLVGAHAELRWEAGIFVREARRFLHWGEDSDWVRPSPGFPEAWDTTYVTVEKIPELCEDLRKKGCTLSNEKMEEAWWMLQLRGIVWTMSVNCLNPGEPIPSSFYENQTLIWMT